MGERQIVSGTEETNQPNHTKAKQSKAKQQEGVKVGLGNNQKENSPVCLVVGVQMDEQKLGACARCVA